MDLGLAGSVVLVTGGTDGLGLALARGLVAEGARVAVCGRDRGRLAGAVEQLEAGGGDVLGVSADVTRPEDLARFVDGAVARWGRVDGLVNNAGRASTGPIEAVADEEWAHDLDLKVMAAVRATRLALPHLRQAPAPAIVNVLAVSARAPGAGSLPTAASRAAGLAVTKALSQELGPDGIRVNAVLVGFVESGQWRRRAEAEGRPVEEVHVRLAAGIPLGRVGRDQEFADLATFLLSPRAGYVTGAAVNLDGGASPVA